MQLYIGNKNYSSWSLRPWLLMTQAGIPFEEKKVRLGWEDDSPFKKTMLALAPTGRVPLLIDDGFRGLGQPGDRREPGRALSRQAALAARPEAAGPGAQPLRRDALGLRRAAQHLRHEHRGAPARGRRSACCARSPAWRAT